MKNILSFACMLVLLGLQNLEAGPVRVYTEKKDGKQASIFYLSGPERQAVILIDDDDALVVRKSAELFAADLEAVTRRKARVTTSAEGLKRCVLIGTLESSDMVRQLVEHSRKTQAIRRIKHSSTGIYADI